MIEIAIGRIDDFAFPMESGQILLLVPDGCSLLSEHEYLDARDRYSDLGYELLYLPRLMQSIPEDLLMYYAPECDRRAIFSCDLIQNRILGELGISLTSPMAVRVIDDQIRVINTAEGDEDTDEFIRELLAYLESDYGVPYEAGAIIGSAALPLMDMSFDECPIGSVPIAPCGPPPSQDEGMTYGRKDEEYSLEHLIDELKEVNESRLRELGLSEAALRFILGRTTPKYSRVRITRHAKIILDDYSGMEIKLDDKTKALYLLYLRHPEGIAIKTLPEHLNELMDLYQSLSGRDDPEAMRKTIEDLVDPFQNNANISLSRIKKAFCEAFTPTLAGSYYIDGERGGLRSISLSRDLVIWETVR